MFGYRNLGFGAFTVADTTFSVANSARFNDDDSDYMEFLPSQAPTSDRICTIAFWVKRSSISNQSKVITQGQETGGVAESIHIYFRADDKFEVLCETAAGAATIKRTTTQVFRDPHAWYHFCIRINGYTSDDSACIIEVNGSAIASADFDTRTNPSSSTDLATFNNVKALNIGRLERSSSGTFGDYYLAQFVGVDGGSYDASKFGEFDTVGRWKPKSLTDTLDVSSTAEAIVNSTSAVSTTDARTYTFSSVAFGTASATRAIYAFFSGQHSTGNTPTFAEVTIGGITATQVILVNNTTEAHYAGALFRADVPSGTSGDIVVGTTTAADNMSQLGVIAWAVTGDHRIYDIKTDTDTSSDTTTSVSLTGVPSNSVILAGRASATSNTHTWSGNVTENIDQIVEGTVRHTGASTATSGGGNFTITCAADSGSDGRGRMFALALSPNVGAGNNGFYLPFTESGVLGADLAETGRTAPSVSFLQSAASTSNAQNYTFSSQSLGTAASDRKIIACVNSSAVSSSLLSVSSVTIGGVSATEVVAGNADGNNNQLQPFAIFIADVPSGTSGDVVVSLNANNGANCHIALYRATGAGGILSQVKPPGSFPAPTSLTITAQVPENSVTILHGNKNGKDVAVNLVGVTEEYDFGHESDSGADMRTFGGINTSAASSGAVALTTSATLASGSGSYFGIATIVIKPVGDNSFLSL